METMDRQEVMNEAVRRLVEYFRPEKIYLYGSTARGEDRPDSDLDFLVVEPRVENRYAEAIRLREALRNLDSAVDVLVVSAKVFQEWADTPNTVIYEAAREGKVYEKVA